MLTLRCPGCGHEHHSRPEEILEGQRLSLEDVSVLLEGLLGVIRKAPREALWKVLDTEEAREVASVVWQYPPE